jgi:hypothetical protein
MTIGVSLEPRDRDILIRTIAGEAANQGEQGWEGVAHTILNRVADDRWGGTPADVALQRNQFSAWNTGSGGNSIPRNMSSDSDLYKRIGQVLDEVVAGKRPDPTGGAVYYYAPGGMPGGRAPSWWDAATSERGGGYTTIGGHRFAGQVGGRGTREGAAAQRNAAAAAQAAKPAKSAAMGLSNAPATIGGRSTKAVAAMGVPPGGGRTIGSLFANAINPPAATAGMPAKPQARGGLFAGLFSLGQQQPARTSKAMGIASAPSIMVSRGSQDTGKVQGIQTKLNSMGYNSGPVDGLFGPVTERAVRTFQRDKGLEEDGIVGPKTSYALDKRDRLGEGGGSESKSVNRSQEKSGGGFGSDFRDSFKR